jgi:hypothetical protein
MGDLNRAIAGLIGMTNGTAEVKKFGCESKKTTLPRNCYKQQR